MRRSTIVSLNRTGFIDFINRNHQIILMTVLFIAGIAIGTISFQKSESAAKLAETLFNSYFNDRAGHTFFSVMISSAVASLLYLLIVFLGGASLLGVVMVPLLVCCRGFLFGALSAFLYSGYSLKGIAFNAVMIIPSSLIFVACLLFAARESIGFSTVLARLTFPKSAPVNLYIDFKNYCGRYLFLSVIILISSLVDAVLSSSFISFFEF